MSTIIAQTRCQPHPHPDAAARQRRDRLARATGQEMESVLAFLSMIDPQAFEIAFTAATPPDGEIAVGGIAQDEEPMADEEPVPVCRECGALVGIFLAHGLRWRHFRGSGTTSGDQEIYDPGHLAEATWLLPGDDPDDL